MLGQEPLRVLWYLSIDWTGKASQITMIAENKTFHLTKTSLRG